MTLQERAAIVIKNKSKGQIIKGRYIDFIPFMQEHGEYVVKFRNQDKSRYSFNQSEPSTIERQDKWYDGYKARDNDLYWCIYNKLGIAIGTVRLYRIELDGSRCTHGSFAIDEAYAMNGPFALEALILSLDFAFDTLQMDMVLNEVRIENKNMNSISKRIGFQLLENFEWNKATYNRYELTKNAYKREFLENLLAMWDDRS